MIYLGLDVGDRRIGVAVGDDSSTQAQPLTTLLRKGGQADGRAIGDLMRQRRAERLVVGLPFDVSGDEGSQALRTRAFAERLQSQLDCAVEYVDERYTTVEAGEAMRAGVGRRGRHDVDAVAAAMILQRFLDRHSQGVI